MNEQEISKLAREYAEYVNSDMDFVDDAEHDFVIGKWTKDVAEVISWLLRDHCIVKKSEVEKEIDVNEFFEFGSEHSEKATGALTTLQNLFPDLFKERSEV